MVKYHGAVFNSFPPAPSLIEFPFVVFCGRLTPNNVVQLVFIWLAMIMAYFILEKLTGNRFLSYVASVGFFWGSNILYLSLRAPVWHQGHLYGVFFVVAAFFIVLYGHKPLSLLAAAFFLGWTVGCRPLNVLYVPLLFYMGFKRYSVKQTLIFSIAGLLPAALFIGIYNFVRFGSPAEFGHIYLAWSEYVHFEVFGFSWLPRNLYYTFLNLPEWDYRGFLTFSGRGTAVWLTNPFIFLGFIMFLRKSVPLRDKLMAGATGFALWLLLLLHCGNGWFQFGYRYIVDLIPLFIIMFGWAYKELKKWMIPVGAISILINIYGAIWFYYFSRLP